jgi:hypothetical protein
MLKRTVVRLLLFVIPLGLSYWVTRPTPPVTLERTFVVCAYSGDRPGELRISLDSGGCPEREFKLGHETSPAAIVPAGRSIPESSGTGQEPLSIPF